MSLRNPSTADGSPLFLEEYKTHPPSTSKLTVTGNTPLTVNVPSDFKEAKFVRLDPEDGDIRIEVGSTQGSLGGANTPGAGSMRILMNQPEYVQVPPEASIKVIAADLTSTINFTAVWGK